MLVVYPDSYEVNPLAISERGSSATGHCSNMSDSGRVCNTPRTSVLFDGIIAPPVIEGDLKAMDLLTLNTSISSTIHLILTHLLIYPVMYQLTRM